MIEVPSRTVMVENAQTLWYAIARMCRREEGRACSMRVRTAAARKRGRK